MKKYFILFLSPLLAFALLEWTTVKLDDRVSVQFPSAPSLSEIGGNPMWIADIDTNSRCMAITVDLGKKGLDSATFTPMLEQDEFYEQYRTSTINSIGDIKFVEEKRFKIGGRYAYEFVLEKEMPDMKFNYKRVYIRSLFVGTKVYSLSFFQKQPADDQRQKFFESLTVQY
jgi:hypothetical protein